jgi:hypothetical protein
MYIRELVVRDVKLLRDVTISFLRDGQPRLWTVLLGENGFCKTTILQAIALAASGVDRANQLAEIASLPDRRLRNPEVFLSATFSFGPAHAGSRTYPEIEGPPGNDLQVRSELTLSPGWNVFQGSSQYVNHGPSMPLPALSLVTNPLREARGKSLPHWFVAGYGVQRLLPVPQTTSDFSDPVLERMMTLFNKGRIVGTSFADLFHNTTLVQAFSKQLQEALLHGESLLPRVTNLELRGKGGVRKAKDLVESHRFAFQTGAKSVKVPATWLSQGYQGMIAWVADMIGHQFWEVDAEVPVADMEGLVLIDELDLFLHPKWQVGLIRALKATFPRMQFVVTTHSPMLLVGCERDEVCILREDEEGNIGVEEATASPALMSGSEIYNVFFGVDSLYPNEAGALLQEYGFLASNPRRSDAEEQKVAQLRRRLRDLGVEPDWEPVARRGG